MTSHPHSPRTLPLTALAVFLAGLPCTTLHARQVEPTAAAATAQPAASVPVTAAPSTAVATTGRDAVTLDLRRLGAWSTVRLTGAGTTRALLFNLQPDTRVTGATLKLHYDYSPSLVPELSHLIVELNDRAVAVLPLPAGASLGNIRDITLDPTLFRERNNELRLRFVGRTSAPCDGPFNSALWMTIGDRTQLRLDLAPARPGQIDLSRAPDLFAQPGASGATDPQVVPVVFDANAGAGAHKAAGIVASWLAAETRNRQIRFEVHSGRPPRGNAIVLTTGGITGVQTAQTATLSLQANPADADGRLLVLAGSDDAALERAARALALTGRALRGDRAEIRRDVAMPVRQPYDAPAWLPLDRPVRFGEIAGADELNVRGYTPGTIRLNYRIPPDLFLWRSQGAPVTLRYQATSNPSQWNSALNVSLNREQLISVGINDERVSQSMRPTDIEESSSSEAAPPLAIARQDGSPLRTVHFDLPAHAVTGRDQMQLQFSFETVVRGLCQNVPVDNMIGTIDAESTVDFSAFPHYAPMPNLASFSSLGFPFTRMADLSETAVVLSERPDAHELALYLSAMAVMGEATGYPVLRHALATAATVDAQQDRDLLVIGAGQGQKLLTQWADHLPVATVDGERRLRYTVESWRPTYRWEDRDIDPLADPAGEISLAAPGTLSALMGFESPLQSGRSVVFLYADRPEGLDRLAAVLADANRWPEIKGDFSMVDDRFIETAKVTPTYYIGSLPAENKLLWFLRDQPLVVALAGLLGVLLLAVLAYRRLRRR